MISKIFTSLFLLCTLLMQGQELKITGKTLPDFNNKLQSYQYINQLQNIIEESHYLTRSWVHIDKISDTPEKNKLKNYHTVVIPETLANLKQLATHWTPSQNNLLLEVSGLCDTLIIVQTYIMEHLNSFAVYDDPFIMFEIIPMVEESGQAPYYTDLCIEKTAALKSVFQYACAKYLPHENSYFSTTAFDSKTESTKAFINYFGLDYLITNDDKFQEIYNYYNNQELIDAVNETIEKDAAFYKKYNILISNLSK